MSAKKTLTPKAGRLSAAIFRSARDHPTQPVARWHRSGPATEPGCGIIHFAVSGRQRCGKKGKVVIGRSTYARCIALLLMPFAVACQQAPADQSAVAQPASTPAFAGRPTAPPPPADADAILAENDRVIAENRHMTQTLDGYRRADGDKLNRLKSGCEQTLGAAADRDGAKRIFECVEAGW